MLMPCAPVHHCGNKERKWNYSVILPPQLQRGQEEDRPFVADKPERPGWDKAGPAWEQEAKVESNRKLRNPNHKSWEITRCRLKYINRSSVKNSNNTYRIMTLVRWSHVWDVGWEGELCFFAGENNKSLRSHSHWMTSTVIAFDCIRSNTQNRSHLNFPPTHKQLVSLFFLDWEWNCTGMTLCSYSLM